MKDKQSDKTMKTKMVYIVRAFDRTVKDNSSFLDSVWATKALAMARVSEIDELPNYGAYIQEERVQGGK